MRRTIFSFFNSHFSCNLKSFEELLLRAGKGDNTMLELKQFLETSNGTHITWRTFSTFEVLLCEEYKWIEKKENIETVLKAYSYAVSSNESWDEDFDWPKLTQNILQIVLRLKDHQEYFLYTLLNGPLSIIGGKIASVWQIVVKNLLPWFAIENNNYLYYSYALFHFKEFIKLCDEALTIDFKNSIKDQLVTFSNLIMTVGDYDVQLTVLLILHDLGENLTIYDLFPSLPVSLKLDHAHLTNNNLLYSSRDFLNACNYSNQKKLIFSINFFNLICGGKFLLESGGWLTINTWSKTIKVYDKNDKQIEVLPYRSFVSFKIEEVIDGFYVNITMKNLKLVDKNYKKDEILGTILFCGNGDQVVDTFFTILTEICNSENLKNSLPQIPENSSLVTQKPRNLSRCSEKNSLTENVCDTYEKSQCVTPITQVNPASVSPDKVTLEKSGQVRKNEMSNCGTQITELNYSSDGLHQLRSEKPSKNLKKSLDFLNGVLLPFPSVASRTGSAVADESSGDCQINENNNITQPVDDNDDDDCVIVATFQTSIPHNGCFPDFSIKQEQLTPPIVQKTSSNSRMLRYSSELEKKLMNDNARSGLILQDKNISALNKEKCTGPPILSRCENNNNKEGNDKILDNTVDKVNCGTVVAEQMPTNTHIPFKSTSYEIGREVSAPDSQIFKANEYESLIFGTRDSSSISMVESSPDSDADFNVNKEMFLKIPKLDEKLLPTTSVPEESATENNCSHISKGGSVGRITTRSISKISKENASSGEVSKKTTRKKLFSPDYELNDLDSNLSESSPVRRSYRIFKTKQNDSSNLKPMCADVYEYLSSPEPSKKKIKSNRGCKKANNKNKAGKKGKVEASHLHSVNEPDLQLSTLFDETLMTLPNHIASSTALKCSVVVNNLINQVLILEREALREIHNIGLNDNSELNAAIIKVVDSVVMSQNALEASLDSSRQNLSRTTVSGASADIDLLEQEICVKEEQLEAVSKAKQKILENLSNFCPTLQTTGLGYSLIHDILKKFKEQIADLTKAFKNNNSRNLP